MDRENHLTIYNIIFCKLAASIDPIGKLQKIFCKSALCQVNQWIIVSMKIPVHSLGNMRH